jgi:preprotein translocase subunit SecG
MAVMFAFWLLLLLLLQRGAGAKRGARYDGVDDRLEAAAAAG